jgi:hypothetical protein
MSDPWFRAAATVRVQQLADDKCRLQNRNSTLLEYNRGWEKRCLKAERLLDQWHNHYMGLEAERNYLLRELDKAYGGQENNPARKKAYEGEDDARFRIPCGRRKGESVTVRDHYYFDGFIRVFKKHHSGKAKSWKEWFGARIFD